VPDLLTRKTSLTEYLLLPYDGKRTEFVNGQIVNMAEASPLHVEIIKILQKLLDIHIEEIRAELATYTGVGIEIPRTERDNNVRDPDVVVCDRQQWKAMRHLTKAIFCEGNPPALAIEVASPGDVLLLTLDEATDSYSEMGEYRGDEFISSALFPDLKVTATTLLNPP
jgi:Uma2 family endonuclease